MSYQVIARKYRPQRFAEVVGQEHVTRTLSQAIQQGRIAHAYLFCGPRGTGKTTVARIFAKCLNCTGGPSVDFDESDPRCVEISQGRSLDVLEIDGASNNGVDQVRELRETCKYAPASSKFKIYIIDEVHMLSTAAFNALLKTLEEPPAHVKFMFATTDPEKVLPTILSRCQRFDLRRIPTGLISKHLAYVAEQEKVTVDTAALHAIARGAEGGMRDAESTLDQLISFCGAKIEEADVLSMFGLAAQGQLLALCDAIFQGRVEDSLRVLNDMATQGKDLGRLMSDLLSHVRNLLIFKVSNGDLSMLEVSEAEATALKNQSGSASQEIIGRVLEALAETDGRMRNAASRKIVMEVGILKAIEARNSVSLDAVLKQLQTLRESSGGASIAPAAKSPPQPTGATRERPAAVGAPAPAPSPAQAVPAPSAPQSAPALQESAVSASSPAALWEVLINTASPMLRPTLEKAHPVSLENGVFTIGIGPDAEGYLPLLDNPRNIGAFQSKLREAGHGNIQIRIARTRSNPVPSPAPAIADASAPPQSTPGAPPPDAPARKAAVRKTESTPAATRERPAAPPVFNKEEFKNDPLIAKALEIFKGQIVEIKS